MNQSTSIAAVLDRGLNDALRRTGVPVGFAGLVSPDQQRFVISTLRGTFTNSLANLTVRHGEGLGGKALALGRAASVNDYHSARGITRRYDRAVTPERLTSILSVPVAMPGEAATAVLYLAERQESLFGSVLHDQLRPVVARMAQELHIEREIARRARHHDKVPDPVGPPPLAPDVRAELVDLAATTTDSAVRERLARLLSGIGPEPEAAPPAPACLLTPRELEVVAAAADGLSNADAAARLGLTESTVKSYMKTAMAKLGAANRVQAGLTARRLGYLS